MAPTPDVLDALLDWESGSEPAAIWRGYVLHSLLFYRQNNLRRFGDLVRLGRRPVVMEKHAVEVLKGLRCHERYWGSLRLGDRALAHFEAAIRLAPESVWGHLFAGMTHEMHRRYARAVVCFERAMALRPEWVWPYMLRGICRWYMADFKESIADFSKAVTLDPRSELPLLFLGRAKADVKDRSLVKDLTKAARLAPKSGFALSWRGRALFVLKRTPAALRDLKRSIKLLPRYDRGYSWLGISYVELGKWRPALKLLEKAAKLNPYYPTTLYPLAHVQMLLGQWDRAAKVLKNAAAVDRHGVWVEHRISRDHPNPACLRSLRDLDAYLEKRPRAAWAWAWRGQTKLLLQQYPEAIGDLDQALLLKDKTAWPFLWRGEAYRRLGLYTEALADFDRAGELSWAQAGRGFCLLKQDRLDEALKALDHSLSLQGHCPEALAWKGEVLYRLGRLPEAVSFWEEALELHHHEVRLYGFLWKAKSRLGDWEGARAALVRYSDSLGGKSDKALAALGWVYGRLGDEVRAIEALGRSLKLNPRQGLAIAETASWWARRGQAAKGRRIMETAAGLWPSDMKSRAAERPLSPETVEALLEAER